MIDRNESRDAIRSNWGEPFSRSELPPESLERFRRILPDQLIAIWEVDGWAGYGDGLLWTVDPDDYRDIFEDWLGEQLSALDTFHCFARSAFGDLFAIGERSASIVRISCAHNNVYVTVAELRRDCVDAEIEILSAFLSLDRESIDLRDKKGRYLFEDALALSGPLTSSTMYGFVPALVLGGPASSENVQQLDADVHLAFLRQLDEPNFPFGEIDFSQFS